MIRQLFDFIQCSPTASHTAATVRAMLVQAGFEELSETQAWDLQPGGKYFTVRVGNKTKMSDRQTHIAEAMGIPLASR